MELCEQLQHNAKVQEIIAKMAKTSKKQVGDVVLALNKMVETSPRAQVIEERIHKTYIMCACMEPIAEDVIAMLLHVAHANLKAPLKCFEEWFYKGKAQKYFQWMVGAFNGVLDDARSEKQKARRTAEVDCNVMKRVCDRMYAALIKAVKGPGETDTTCVFAAYDLAQKAYGSTAGNMGELYLAYPISVAAILAEAGLDAAVVAASLLHNVTSRTSYTVEDIRRVCNLHVADYVQAAMEVRRAYEAIHIRQDQPEQAAYLDATGFRDVAALVSKDPKLLAALCIKAADRIHWLRLQYRLPEAVRLADEERLDYLPLLRQLNLNYFAAILEDLEWRGNNPDDYRAISRTYEDLLKQNSSYITMAYEDLCECFVRNTAGRHFSDGRGGKEFDVKISKYRYLSLEVYRFAKECLGEVLVGTVDKTNVPLCDFDIVVEPAEKVDAFLALFVKTYLSRYDVTQRTVVDYTVDAYGRYVLMVEDAHRCVFRMCISSRMNRDICRGGNQKLTAPSHRPKEVSTVGGSTIRVYLRNGKPITLPKGACVLDVAFAIHPEVGLAAAAATVNGNEARLHDKLRDGDKVIIVADTDRQGRVAEGSVYHVKITWLVFVVTDKARKAIIKWAHEKYEAAAMAQEVEVSDARANSAIDTSIAALREIGDFEQLG